MDDLLKMHLAIQEQGVQTDFTPQEQGVQTDFTPQEQGVQTDFTPQDFTPSDRRRFWSKVDKNGPIHPVLQTRCWVFKGAELFMMRGKTIAPYRVAWILTGKPLIKPMVCHHCDNRKCVRFTHLFNGDQFDNMQDASKKGRMKGVFQPKVTCPYGHPYDGTFFDTRSARIQRYCKTCAKEKNQTNKQKEYKHQWYLEHRILKNNGLGRPAKD